MKHNNNQKDSNWWQRLPISGKACTIVFAVCIIVSILAIFLIRMSGEETQAAQLALAVITIILVIGEACTITFCSAVMSNMDQACDSITQVCTTATEQATQMATEAIGRMDKVVQLAIDSGVFINPDDWEDEAEAYAQRTAQSAVQPEAKPDTPPPSEKISTPAVDTEQIVAQALAELQEYQPESANADIIDRRYQRLLTERGINDPTSSKIVAILDKVHTGEIDVHLVKDVLAGKDQAHESAPAAESPVLAPPEPPRCPSVQEQAAELGMPPTAITYLNYLLQTGNCQHYQDLPPTQREELRNFMRVNAAANF